MATKFLEPGGDATFTVLANTGNGFWGAVGGTPAVATDFVHGGHVKSIKYRPGVTDSTSTPAGTLADAGSRVSVYLYFAALPTGSVSFLTVRNSSNTLLAQVQLDSSGVLRLLDGLGSQIGGNGSTLSTGAWYRLSLACTIASTAVNEFRLFKDGASDISVSNATLNITGSSLLRISSSSADATFDFRASDVYVDDSGSLLDPGDVWVTAKRPNANGTANNFTTQIGAGGSGYGTGHSPQVNERALSTTNGWSVAAVGATTEEYNVEGKATGDVDLSTAVVLDCVGWVSTKALAGETGQIVLNGAASSISITTTIKVFTKAAGSPAYPAGTGTDIGLVTDATATTVSLYECGVLVAYIPRRLKTVNGLAVASVKTVNGLAIASVKTVNGLT